VCDADGVLLCIELCDEFESADWYVGLIFPGRVEGKKDGNGRRRAPGSRL
jgi:hypothetical protein